jgi:hypothetical protein
MTYVAPLLILLGLVCLTAPDGFAIWVEKSQVVSILHPVDGECPAGAKAKVTLGNGTQVCVRDERKDIAKMLQDGDDK